MKLDISNRLLVIADVFTVERMKDQDLDPPPFKSYFATRNDLDRNQLNFYDSWCEQWRKGNAVPVRGQVSYLFCYVRERLNGDPRAVAAELGKLIRAYPDEPQFLEIIKRWQSDCYALLGDFTSALAAFPTIEVDARSTAQSDRLLSLKLQTGDRVSGRDILALTGPKVTKWGKDHIDQVAQFLDIQLAALEQNEGRNLLNEWAHECHQSPYHAFVGTSSLLEVGIPLFSISLRSDVAEFVRAQTREAENSVREEMNIPRVGEGWIGETELFYALRGALPDTDVVQHARPKWLGRQHLDVFIPAHAVAFEYQGLQHDQPVAFFGGQEAFEQTQKRDAEKKRKCSKHGVRLIEVRPGYSLEQLLSNILSD
ncbi:hypothetical protein EHN06_03030 [Marinobacter sp. NP-4(2019)]|uniref:TerB N-terminal domain-containing protein n=1 Tax=Marinobacter sp. NP-4(2019) TaxID=2488665 RepID=UPI000FC3E912|nr:TerB N-terminal domain-containing protein [Marinobacter sp. NP-4(2019)]AZT82597.1 hypothetical protein EHN06_03030 [Marinobacter sp. NP-4(2019)]